MLPGELGLDSLQGGLFSLHSEDPCWLRELICRQNGRNNSLQAGLCPLGQDRSPLQQIGYGLQGHFAVLDLIPNPGRS